MFAEVTGRLHPSGTRVGIRLWTTPETWLAQSALHLILGSGGQYLVSLFPRSVAFGHHIMVCYKSDWRSCLRKNWPPEFAPSSCRSAGTSSSSKCAFLPEFAFQPSFVSLPSPGSPWSIEQLYRWACTPKAPDLALTDSYQSTVKPAASCSAWSSSLHLASNCFSLGHFAALDLTNANKANLFCFVHVSSTN